MKISLKHSLHLQEESIGAAAYLRNSPANGVARNVSRFSSNNQKSIKVFRLDDLVLLSSTPPLLVTPTGHILYESSAYRDFPVPLRTYLSTNTIEVCNGELLQGEYCLLCGIWDYQFWHWMMDYLPKAVVAEAAGFRGKYIVPSLDRVVIDSLDIIGVPRERLAVRPDQTTRVPSLLLVQAIEGFKELPNYPRLVQHMRQKLIEGSQSAFGQIQELASPRLYIERKIEDRPRKLVNEVEVLEVLEPFGFQAIRMEKLSLRAQILLASRANVMFGPHGAGMLHALFMSERSLVIECFSPNYVLTSHVRGLSLLEHRYFSLVGENGPNWPYQGGEDVIVDTALLRSTLSRELARSVR